MAALALLCALAFPFPFVARPASAQEGSEEIQAQVEGAFLVNFLRYTDWPGEPGTPNDEPYVITVVGDAEMAATLARLTRVVAPVRGRRVEVHRAEYPEGADANVRAAVSDRLRRSHLVFVRGGAEPVAAVLGELSGQPVLTVSDRPDFVRDGGMLGLRREGSRIGIDANPAAIRNARLVVSAKVLKLARIIDGTVR